jgi:hypothetical protein
MILKLNRLPLCILALLPLAATAQAPTPSTAPAETVEGIAQTAAVARVMEEFHHAVVTHDGSTLAGLFLPDANIWLNVLTGAAYDRMHASAAQTPRVRVSSYRDFAKYVSTTSNSLDPEHSNVVIHTDGTIAAAYFDFVFRVNGKVENHGSETWQLVNTADGWRIAAITYSSDPAMQ